MLVDFVKDFFFIRKPEIKRIEKKSAIESSVFYSLAFLFPFIIILSCAVALEIAPFGNKTLMAIDAWGQYFPMLREMKRAFRSLDFSYSFTGALGFDITAQSAYYTNSPLWYLLFLLPGELTPGQVDMMVFVRFALAGLTFSHYLSSHYGEKNSRMIFISLGYAFSGYTLSFINQFMWMDAVILLPLVLLGIENLYKGKGLVLYTVSLFVTIYTNFYIAYAVCIFSVLWFFLQVITDWKGMKHFIMSCSRFGLCSLTAGILNLGVLLPLLKAIGNTLASDMGFTGEIKWYHTPSVALKLLFPFEKASLGFGAANIYFGIIPLVLGFFAVGVKISLRKKLSYVLLLIFMFISFNVNILDFIWHGFHFPNQLPGRQSFIFIFLGLVISYAGIEVINKVHMKDGKYGTVVVAVLCAAVCCEIVGNTAFRFNSDVKYVYEDSVLRNEAAMSEISEKYGSDKDENEFWRIETVPHRYNGGQLYGYNGISHYSSTMSGDCYNFFMQLGMDRYAKNVSIEYVPNPVLNSLFSVRYIASTEEMSDGVLQYEGKADNMFVYENPAVLPMFYVSEKGVLDVDMTLSGYAFANDIFTKISGTDNVITANPFANPEDENSTEPLYLFDEEEFLKGIDSILQSKTEITDFGKTEIKGTVDAAKDGILIITLPHHDAEIIIDGEETETLKIAGYLAGAEITEGYHEITIKLP